MDDGGRCLLDVIDDPQLLQSFLENTNGAIERLEGGVNPNVDNPSLKTLATVKPIDSTTTAAKVAVNIPSMTSLVSESKQTIEQQLTTAYGTNTPSLITLNKQTSGQLIFDEKQMLNMVSSSVGLIPFSALSSAGTASISIAQPALTTMTSTTPIGQMTSSIPLRAPGPTWAPTSFQITGPRAGGAMTVLPQQLQQLIVQPTGMPMGGAPGLQQLLLTAPRPGGPHASQLPGGIQPGQLVQIIQTPSGPQILQTNPSAALQTIVSSGTTTKTSSTTSSSRSNKQILPKPPGSGVSVSNTVTTNSANKCGQQMTQQNTLKVINSLPPNMTQIPTSGSSGPTQQILIGPGGQQMISGPQGTFLLNHMIPGLGSQPILIQQNIGNVPNSVQLTLRPQSHSSPMVAMSNGLNGGNDQNAGLINALTGQSNNISKQTPSQSPQPQTFVIPNHSTSVSTSSSGVVMTSAGRPTPNIIFTRPPSFYGASHQSTPTVPTGQQFLQLQTPNGPILVALPNQAQLLQHQQSNATQPTHGIQLGNTMFPIGAPQMTNNLNTSLQASAHPALHALLTDNASGQTVIQTSHPSVQTSNTVIFTSQPQIITRPQIQQQSKPSVNLAELLKEHGILPESSPPSSPTNNSMTDISNGSLHQELIQTTQPSQQTVLMLPSGPNQPPNIVLTQNGVTQAAPPQLRLALGPDGSVILQPHITNAVPPQIQSQFISNSNNLKYSDSLKDSSGLGSSQPSPDSTTPSIDSAATTSTTSSGTTTTTTTTGQNTSALLDQLNTGPAVKVPDLVASLGLSNGSSTPMTTSEETKPLVSQLTPQMTSQMTSQTTLIPLTVQSINKSLEQQKQTILTIPVQNGDNVVPNVSNGSSNAVIRIGSCDSIPTSLVLTTTPTTVFTSPPKAQTIDMLSGTLPLNNSSNNNTNSVGVNGTATTVIEQNGVPMVQVSPNNQEFLQRLETQLKSLSSLKSPTNQQKELLQEMLSLKQKMNEARHLKTNEDQKVVFTTNSSITVSPQTQQLLQSSSLISAQSQPQPPQQQNQSPIEAQTQQTPQNMHLVNLLKQTPVQTSQQIRLVTSANSSVPVSGTATIQVGNQLITFTTPAKQHLQNLKSIATNQNQTVIKVINGLHVLNPFSNLFYC